MAWWEPHYPYHGQERVLNEANTTLAKVDMASTK